MALAPLLAPVAPVAPAPALHGVAGSRRQEAEEGGVMRRFLRNGGG